MRVVPSLHDKANNIHGQYFLNFSLQNVRCFGKKQTLNLSDAKGKPYPWTIILGENGVGKTTVLKGLASLAPSPGSGEAHQTKFYPGLLDWRDQWNTRRFDGKDPSVFEADTIAGHGFSKLAKDQKSHFSIQQRHVNAGDVQYDESVYKQPDHFLSFAYGASRRMGQTALSPDHYAAASTSLFDDEAPLMNVEEFFLAEARTSAAKKQREKIKALVIDLLPEVSGLRISKKGKTGRQAEVKTPYGWVRIGELSAAYKSLTAWVVDFARRMCSYHGTTANPFHGPAIVLIDEIELHLHPKWQRKIVGYLSKKFPNTQFIATTNSPVIVQAALEANLVLLKRKGPQVVVDNHPDVMKNWRIDQILTSDLFGLTSVRSEKAEKIMTQRRNLLLKPKLTKTEKAKLATLEKRIDYVPVAETPEYIQAMQIIRSSSEKMS